MKKIHLMPLFVFIFSLHTLLIQAQERIGKETKQSNNAPETFQKHLFTGGNIGLQLGTISNIDISPMLGYRINDYIAFGVGATYQFYRYHDYYYDQRTEIYGGRVFTRIYPFKMVFLHAEYEMLNLESAIFDPGYNSYSNKRFNVFNPLVGAGYKQEMNDNVSSTIMILWNLNNTGITPYGSPIIRVGVEINLGNNY